MKLLVSMMLYKDSQSFVMGLQKDMIQAALSFVQLAVWFWACPPPLRSAVCFSTFLVSRYTEISLTYHLKREKLSFSFGNKTTHCSLSCPLWSFSPGSLRFLLFKKHSLILNLPGPSPWTVKYLIVNTPHNHHSSHFQRTLGRRVTCCVEWSLL